jgi:acyl-CoA thioesterase FadM
MLRHVNNVNVQHYFDSGKNDFFHKVTGYLTGYDKQGIITAATSSSYLGQTRLTDNVYVETSVEKVGNKSVTLFQRLIARPDGEVRAESRSVMVAYDFEHQRSIVVPQPWRERLEAAIEKPRE